MPLQTGSKLGPYEIQGAVGAGGMGEVYRARDSRLERTVAIKVLPQHLSDKPELKQRLEREAKSISNLSHPNICTLYDVGEQEGATFLVLEFLEGETLEQRLVRGPLPAEQVLRLAIEMTDALEKAHKQGIIHRDLKPANIMLTKTGAKLMDFGLAKLSDQPAPVAAALSELTADNRKLTAEGAIVGTFQYMAPEQLEGREADARTDLFALGMVLYEMATGKAAFTGKTKASLIASILTSEPPAISTTQPLTPPALDRVVKTCLAKDPDERFQTAHDLNLQLRWILEGGSQAGVAAPVVARRKHREWMAWGTAAVMLVAAAVLGGLYLQHALTPPRVIESTLLPPANANFSTMANKGAPAISPDGTRLAFIAAAGGRATLWVRPLNSSAATELEGTEGAFAPFWSPDSRSIGFFVPGRLEKVDASGGPPQVICSVQDARGGSWGRGDVIIFAASRNSPISRVSANGGDPAPVTKLGQGEGSHRWPFFLPDGEHFLYLVSPTGSATEINVIKFASLDGRDDRVAARGISNGAYALGHLLFLRGESLVAQPFDARRGQATGEAAPIAGHVHFDSIFASATFSVSEGGILVYQAGAKSGGARLLWYDRHGKSVGQVGEPDAYGSLALSPDGRRLAVMVYDASLGYDLWTFDLDRNIRTRLTFGGGNGWSAWSPDGRSIAFRNSSPGGFGLYVKPSDGSGREQALLGPDAAVFPNSWSRDGRFLAYQRSDPKTNFDVWVLPMTGERKPFQFVQGPAFEGNPQFSPDGKWIAYQSDESGRAQIYVAQFPGPGGKWQVSSTGGTQPKWSRDGKELYYLGPTQDLMAVSIRENGTILQPGNPTLLFNVPVRNIPIGAYDVDAKGRFVVATGTEESSQPLTLVQNWTEALKKK